MLNCFFSSQSLCRVDLQQTVKEITSLNRQLIIVTAVDVSALYLLDHLRVDARVDPVVVGKVAGEQRIGNYADLPHIGGLVVFGLAG